ncbi:MAG: methyl-accepting chemotaxis protein, partial [Vallitaleaceae bacterium]|nr:methyl-accepting chemotaxis protein [Vallitaleaceae bacterium]
MIIDNAQKLSDGQLNIADIKNTDGSSYKVLARALNQMKSNLLTFIEQTKNNVITLNESIDQVSSSMKKSSKGNEQISATISDVSDKSQEQLRLARVTVEKMEEANEKIDSIATHIHDVQDFSADTHVTTTEGIEKIGAYNENIQVIFTNLNYTNEYIIKLRDDIEQIETISNFIENISNKLKLLAMNASIEAARSGEAGKGFAVVSEEITKLSEATKEGIGRVQNMVVSILDNSGSVVSSVDNIKGDFETGIDIFDGVKVIFHDIQEKSSSILNEINEVGDEIGNINEITKQTSKMSQEVFDFSIGVSEGTKEISDVIKDETAELISITNSTDSLLSMLGKIESLTNKFDLDIKPINKQPKKKVRIAVVCPYNVAFWYPVEKGAIYAKQTLQKFNTEVDFIGIEAISIVNYTKAVEQAIEAGYDGIAISGMYKELVPLVEKATNKHIPIITFNSDFEEDSTRMAFVGQNAYEAGVVSAEAMLQAIDNKGNVVVITSDLTITSHELRRKGFNDR